MPLIAIIAFVICVVLFVLLSNVLANRKQIKAAYEYGKKNFDIELPENASTNSRGFHKLSDEAAFFTLVIPYLGSLNDKKQAKLIAEIEKLKSDLKIDASIYDRFVAEMPKKDAP